jgi:hypothetical protein
MAIETLRPTANVNPTLGSAWSSPANAYDGNSGTAATANESTTNGSVAAAFELTTWQTAAFQSGYSALALKVSYSISVSTTSTGAGTASALWSLAYSTDGGSTFTVIASGSGSQSLTTAVVTLATNQDLTKLQFAISVSAAATPRTGTAGASCDGSLVDVWTEGTYVPGLAGCSGHLFGF